MLNVLILLKGFTCLYFPFCSIGLCRQCAWVY